MSSRSPIVPWLVLFVGILIVFYTFYEATLLANSIDSERFDAQTEELADAISDRMLAYEQVLAGGRGLFAASQSVERHEWKSFVDAQRIQERFPGIQAIGYVERVTRDELDSFVDGVRQQGIEDYSITPENDKDEYYPVKFIEPSDIRNQRALGFDISSEPLRRMAIEYARDTGDVSITGKVILVQETKVNTQPGLLMLMPYYGGDVSAASVEERRAALQGLVYAAFRANDLMTGIVGATVRDVSFMIYDDTLDDDNLLYDYGAIVGYNENDYDPTLVNTIELRFGERTWVVTFTALKSIHTPATTIGPYVVLIAGFTLAFMFFYILRSSLQLRNDVSELSRMVQEIANGNLGVQLDSKFKTGNAIRNLAADAGRMRDNIRKHTSDLEKANVDLLSVEKAKDEFMSMISHELKTPIVPIRGYAEMLLKPGLLGSLTPKQNKAAETILKNSHRLELLVQDVLDVYKLDMNRLRFSKKKVTVEELVHQPMLT